MNLPRLLVAATCFVLTTGCDGGGDGGTVDDPGDPTGDPNRDPNGDPAQVETADLIAAHAIPARVADDSQTLATVSAEAVSMASQAAGLGTLVTTGTLTQQGQNSAYSATPNDRLVIAFSEGITMNLWIHDMQGDFTSADAFISNDHRFEFEVQIDDQVDARFTSLRNNGQMTAAIAGELVHEGTAFDLDLTSQGTYFFESDSSGAHFRDEYATSGSVKSDGFDLDVDETWFFELVSASGDSAQSARRTIDSSLTTRGVTYDWVDVVTQKSFRQGKPSQLDTYWQASGDILRDGDAFGRYRLDAASIGSSGGVVKFVVDLPGETIEVESHNAY